MIKETRDTFIFYRSFFEAAKDLQECDRLKLYDAICEMALNENEISLTGISLTIFKVIKPNILANTKRYKDGKKGGRKATKITTGYSEKKPVVIENEKPVGGEEKKPNKEVNKDKEVNNNKNKEVNIPNFIDQILFDEFLQQRKKDKNPIEGLALKLTLEDLEKWESKKIGNANLAIKNAIKGGWKSLIEPKEDFKSNSYAITNNELSKYDYLLKK